MADRITDPKQAGERLLQFCREGRLVQHTWHNEQDGREVACLLGAAAGISEVALCPASLMAPWMAFALPPLFDGQTEAHARAFAVRWGEAMVRAEWTRIDWDAVRDRWMAFVVRQARDAAYAAYAAYADSAAARAAYFAANAAASAAAAAAATNASAACDAARAAGAAASAARDAARDAQADALMDAIEHAMEVARG